MKKLVTLFSFLLILLVVTSFVYSQSQETGALKGTVKLEDGSPVPGVLVKLEAEKIVGATKTTITNEMGNYRFVGIQPGIYILSATLEGFATAKQTGVKISVMKTITIDLHMQQGVITEEVVVMGKSALVDVKESSTATVEMSTDFLQNIPNSQFAPSAVNLAPGITSDVAYGATDSTGISYQIDGIDVSDPAGGSAWVFLDYNVIEEVAISGIGAPAEYGGFTGVIFNSVTKSGGNIFKGYAEFLYQGKDWSNDNTDDPSLQSTGVDFYSAHVDIGGPIIKDKLSFFLSGLLYREKEGVTGQDYDVDYSQPKAFLKLSWQPSTKTRITTFVEYDQYDGTGRDGDRLTEYEATREQISPEAVGNFSIFHQFSDYTFMEAKLAYFWGYFSLNPVGEGFAHWDWGTDEYWGNAAWTSRYDRTRLQANTAVTHHADDFMGSHDFKFGAQLISVTQRDQWKITNGRYYADWYGEPYVMYTYGEGFDSKLGITMFSAFIQDSWTVTDRLTINPGLRYDLSNGKIKGMSGDQYKPKPALAPRIGFTFDIFGDHSTALKAHWGRYYESAYGYSFDVLKSPTSAWTAFYYDQGEWLLDYSIPPEESQYRMDPDIKQTYMDQFTVGIEREVIKDLSLSATFIYRTNHDHVAAVDIAGIYEPVTYNDDYTGNTYTVYNQVNDPADSIYLITNPTTEYTNVLFTPTRKYVGLELLLNKRFSNKWQMLASYVYSKATGNIDNSFATGSGYTSLFQNPNSQINSDGTLGGDYTHMLKIQASVILPLDINVNANFSYISGPTYQLRARLPSSVDSNRSIVYLESRGSRRYPTRTNLDIRVEKTFKLGKLKLGFLLDIFNVFNADTVTSYSTYSTSFENILNIVNPRAFRAGLRVWL
ncbi:TonB-dependent receptor domain-containing protein [Acidobacteriota bacterium]